MLRRFAVENFRSIRDRLELSLEPLNLGRQISDRYPGNVRKDTGLLTALLLYGRNSSGKSNCLMALRSLQSLIRINAKITVNEHLWQYSPHLLDSTTTSAPTTFEVDFIATDQLRYVYSVSFYTNRIEHESLVVYRTSKPSLLFRRTGSDNSTIEFGPTVTGQKNALKSQVLKNHLVLSKGANSNIEAFLPAYNYLTSEILSSGFDRLHSEILQETIYMTPELSRIHFRNREFEIAERASTDPDLLPYLTMLLQAADTTIENVTSEYEEQQIENGSQTEAAVYLVHKGDSELIRFKMLMESEGTRQLLYIGIQLYDAIKKGCVIILDEIDKSLHPLITEFLVGLFANTELNPNGAQLLTTTHSTELLDKVRPDQIVFIEKRASATESYLLADIKLGGVKPREFAAWYLAGRFGAIPTVGPAKNPPWSLDI